MQPWQCMAQRIGSYAVLFSCISCLAWQWDASSRHGKGLISMGGLLSLFLAGDGCAV